MGQKSNPNGLRLGIVKDWDYTWFATADYATFVLEDFNIRKFITNELSRAGISKININRKSDYIELIVKVARPGIIFGKSNIDLDVIIADVSKMTGKKANIKITEEKNQDSNSRLLASWVTGQLEKRIPFRRAMKMAIQKCQKAGAKGIRISCAGRLGGVEIARTESYMEGKVPLHTLRADIDYAFTEALTTYGKIGVKVWIYHGDIIKKAPRLVEQKNELDRVDTK
ncbi:30S ribosomal protein S3 [Candidatus Marinamargulisbacteria bacterium SCGC AAA071-K20]|nr:30S ribosomal protein S3 [Candidatus Marinamargulisbacteria bacterium SCGC AAA071-K20]